MQSSECVNAEVVLLRQGLSLHDMGGGTGPADPAICQTNVCSMVPEG